MFQSKPGLLVVDVTQEDIKGAFRYDSSRCAIARALNRLDGSGWWVNNASACRWVNNNIMFHSLPKEAQLFIQTFDAGEAVAPFVFALENVYVAA